MFLSWDDVYKEFIFLLYFFLRILRFIFLAFLDSQEN